MLTQTPGVEESTNSWRETIRESSRVGLFPRARWLNLLAFVQSVYLLHRLRHVPHCPPDFDSPAGKFSCEGSDSTLEEQDGTSISFCGRWIFQYTMIAMWSDRENERRAFVGPRREDLNLPGYCKKTCNRIIF